MKYEVEIDGQMIALELDERDGRVVATAGTAALTRRYEIAVSHPEEGVYLLLVGDQVYEARLASEDGTPRVTLRGRTFTADVIDRKHRRAGGDHGDASQKPLTAPMPGKVVRVLLQAGDEVAAGQGVIVVEAMKMQNEIKSPKPGRLLEVRAGEGDTVIAGQVLAVVE